MSLKNIFYIFHENTLSGERVAFFASGKKKPFSGDVSAAFSKFSPSKKENILYATPKSYFSFSSTFFFLFSTRATKNAFVNFSNKRVEPEI